jgi:acyl carrier protein
MARLRGTVYHRDGQAGSAEGVSSSDFSLVAPSGRRLPDAPWGRFPSHQDARAVAHGGEDRGVATTFERVRAIVADRLGVDEDKVTMESEFIGDLNADSLDLVEVIMAMEQEFDLEIKDEDAENIRTMADAVQYIDEHSG